MSEEYFQGHYRLWRGNRIRETIAHYGPNFFAGKTLLEVGAGWGDVGNAFADVNAIVTCVEGRIEHVESIRERYPRLTVVHADLNTEWPFTTPFDIIIHWGTLYHLAPEHMENSLRTVCRNTTVLVLETEVADSDDPHFLGVVEEHVSFDQSLDRKGSRPSPAYVERILADEGFQFDMLRTDRCNADGHFYDWQPKLDNTWQHGKRRFWFCHKL